MIGTKSGVALAAIGAALLMGGCAMHSEAMGAQGGAMHMANNAPMAEQSVEVGGAAMYPSRNIIQNAVNSRDHTTLVAAVQAAGLVETLQGAGPFTVFAPTNAAFDKLPPGTVQTLLQPANRAALTKVLTYHVVAGRLSAEDLGARVRAGGGRAVLTTVAGDTLTVTQAAGGLVVTDAAGGRSTITISNVNQSNGVIHVVDSVLLPAQG